MLNRPIIINDTVQIEPLGPPDSVVNVLTQVLRQNQMIIEQNGQILKALSTPSVFVTNLENPEQLSRLAEAMATQ